MDDSKGVDGAATGAVPPAVELPPDVLPPEKDAALENVRTPAIEERTVPLPPPRPPTEAHVAKPRQVSPIEARLRLLRRDISRTFAGAAHAVDQVGGAIGAQLALLGSHLSSATPDQDSAREAVRRGQIAPLDSILKTVEKSVPGDVLKVALNKNSAGEWRYSITVLTPQGYYRDVSVDAGTNRITEIKGH